MNVTLYEGDIAIDIGAQLAEYYEIEPSANNYHQTAPSHSSTAICSPWRAHMRVLTSTDGRRVLAGRGRA